MIRSNPILFPKTFNDVKVFAGDDFYPPSDASYKNLVWENLPVPEVLFNANTPAMVSLENQIREINWNE